MRRAAAVLLGAMAGISAAQPQERVFRRDVEAIHIDARALDRDGHFVRGLTAADFALFEDGREQSITTFDLIEIPVPAAARSGPIVDPDVSSNAPGDGGRVYLIVLDDLHTHPLRSITVRALAREFIERNLGPDDRAAIIATSTRRELATEFTSHRGRLLASVDRFEGGFSAGARCGADGASCLADEHLTLRYLTRLSTWLSGLDGRRKAILFISEGFDSGISDAFTPPDPGSSIFDRLSNINDAAADLREAVTAAARSNVSIFAIDPRGLPGAPAPTIRPVTTLVDDDEAKAVIARQGLEILGQETGGFALVRSNAFSEAFARVVRESSAYYLLGYTSSNTKRDGKFRRVEVRAKHPGIAVRARSGYVARDAKATSSADGGTRGDALIAAMQSPVQIPGVALTMSAAPFRGVKSRAFVAVVVDVRSREMPLSFFVAAADQDGRLKAEERGTMKAGPAIAAAGGDSHGRLATHLALPPGRYQLRAAALDRAGAAGSVHFDLDVPDFSKGPLAISGLLLGDPPTTVRAFSAGETVTVTAEVYDNAGRDGDQIEMTTSLRGESGEAAFSRRELLSRTAGGGRTAPYRYGAAVALKDLAPGRYLLSVDARRTTNAAHRASRQIPITVR
jgi:VWFA-related protein